MTITKKERMALKDLYQTVPWAMTIYMQMLFYHLSLETENACLCAPNHILKFEMWLNGRDWPHFLLVVIMTTTSIYQPWGPYVGISLNKPLWYHRHQYLLKFSKIFHCLSHTIIFTCTHGEHLMVLWPLQSWCVTKLRKAQETSSVAGLLSWSGLFAISLNL